MYGLFSALNIEIGNWNMPFILVNLSSKLESYRESNRREESAVCAVGRGEFQRCPAVFSWDCCVQVTLMQ